MKTLYIKQLTPVLQQAIKKDLIQSLSKLELSSREQSEALHNAMCSKLSDLTDLINISKYTGGNQQ